MLIGPDEHYCIAQLNGFAFRWRDEEVSGPLCYREDVNARLAADPCRPQVDGEN